jgi:hypothetical protein
MSPVECAACGGKRLRPASLAVRVKNFSIAEFTALPVARALVTVRNWEFGERETQIAGRVLDEIRGGWSFSPPWVSITSAWSARPPRFRAANRSASGWPRRSARNCAACSTCSTSLRSACTRATTQRLLETLAPARHGQHGAGGGARRRDHRARRLRDRPGPRRRPPGRLPGGRGRSAGDRAQSGIAHRKYLSGALEIRVPASAARRAKTSW